MRRRKLLLWLACLGLLADGAFLTVVFRNAASAPSFWEQRDPVRDCFEKIRVGMRSSELKSILDEHGFEEVSVEEMKGLCTFGTFGRIGSDRIIYIGLIGENVWFKKTQKADLTWQLLKRRFWSVRP
jgi:hypothetical protein